MNRRTKRAKQPSAADEALKQDGQKIVDGYHPSFGPYLSDCRWCGGKFDRLARMAVSNAIRVCSDECDAKYEANRFFLSDQTEYHKTQNPMCVWHAIRTAAALRAPIPGWVMDYLDQCAGELLSLQEDGDRSEAEIMAKSLGFGGTSRGRSGSIAQWRQSLRDADLACFVAMELRTTAKLEAAYESAAQRFGVTARTARRAFAKHSEEFGLRVLLEDQFRPAKRKKTR